MNNIISPDELKTFKSLGQKKIVDCMELYLIEGYNMSQVGNLVFGKENYSYTVSLIHRIYGFSDRNSGLYRNGCSFERNYSYRVTRQDIEAFVKKYPEGTYSKGIRLEDFLITRANKQKATGVSRKASNSGDRQVLSFDSGEGLSGKLRGLFKKGETIGNQNAEQNTSFSGEPLDQHILKNGKGRSKVSDIWDTGGFKILRDELISFAVSVIPFVIMLVAVFGDRSTSDGIFEKLFDIGGGIWGPVIIIWIFPLFMFLVNGGIRIFVGCHKLGKRVKEPLKSILWVIGMTAFTFIGMFGGECIITLVYILVRVLRKEYAGK